MLNLLHSSERNGELTTESTGAIHLEGRESVLAVTSLPLGISLHYKVCNSFV